jgi:hypothetical protein
MLRRIFRALLRPRPARAPPRPADPRLEADAWLGRMFTLLGERYQLGADAAEGTRLLRRTGRARFNPMPVWVLAAERVVRGEYEVRGDVAAAKALLDARVAGPLSGLGLGMAAESVEEWAGTVLTRRYEGRCETAEAAAAAVRFICEESETQINLAAE